MVWAKILSVTLLMCVLVIGLFPVGEWLLHPLETRFPVNPRLGRVDGIIALSGNLDPEATVQWDQIVAGGAAERNFTFIALARKYPNAKLVYTGGSSSMLHQEYKAADAAKRLFSELGMDTSRIIFERESRNTWENAVLSKKLVQPKNGERWVLITTGWHMPRSVGVFCKIGWDVIPYPVDFHTKPDRLLRVEWGVVGHLSGFVTAVKEWVGLIVYRFAGKAC